MKKVIPTVDVSKFIKGDAAQKATFVEELGAAFSTVGFVGIVNHGVSQTLIDDFYTEAKAFFALPVAIKKQYEIEGLAGQRGYTSFGKEHAKHTDVADLKEFFQIGQESDSANVPVAEKPKFLALGKELYQTFERTGGALLRAIALYLELPEDYFDAKIKEGNSILRAIHYPPITNEPASAIRAEQHEDINLITLLVGASAGGLQLLNKEDEWQSIQTEANEIVVNVGDMLQRLTNNSLRSTTHRVVNPPREMWHLPRLSIPFFLHPIADMDLTCLDNCVSDSQPLAYESITAGEYLNERLREIGLKK
jgi:isopenicillin N synthase-like dioxygenase